MSTKAVNVEVLTSGASSCIVPVFKRTIILIYSSFLCFFLFLFARTHRLSPSLPKLQRRRWEEEQEQDAMRRRTLAEALQMLPDGENFDCRCATSLFLGITRNSLFCRSWFPVSGNLKGIIIIIHGLNEHGGRYAHFARQLTSSNFGVYAMDWTGHGGSDGLHGFVPSLDHVVADTSAFLEKVKFEFPDVPCFLFGHSTGGSIVLKAASAPQIERMVKGIILTSPALRVKPAHPVVEVIAPVFSLVAPRFQFKGANKRGIPVSRDPAQLVAKYTDPLVYTGPIRVRTGHEVLRITAYLTRRFKSITVPFFVLHGTADTVTDPLASQDLFNEAPSKFKDIKLYDGFLHDLLFEPEREEIAQDIINWMEKRLATATATATSGDFFETSES